MSICFDVNVRKQPPDRSVIYRVSEFSFDVEPHPANGFTSFLVNDLSLEVDDQGNVLSVWGLSAYPGWQRGIVQPPEAPCGLVKIRTDLPLSSGISVAVAKENRWPALYDDASGWLVVGSHEKAEEFTEFLAGAILGLNSEKEFEALWLKAVPGL